MEAQVTTEEVYAAIKEHERLHKVYKRLNEGAFGVLPEIFGVAGQGKSVTVQRRFDPQTMAQRMLATAQEKARQEKRQPFNGVRIRGK